MMKKTVILLFGFLSIMASAQDVIDQYSGQHSTTTQGVPQISTSYNGEYMIYMGNHHWYTHFVQNMGWRLSYNIEVVSFPFAPSCMTVGSGCVGSNNRTLSMPISSLSYGEMNSQNGTGDGWGNILFRKSENDGFAGPFSMPNGLASNAYVVNGAYTPAAGGRKMFPHTILKHTINLHCGQTINDPIIASHSWIHDNTRGRMNQYPFSSSNNASNSEIHYDVIFIPELKTNPNGQHSFSEQNNNWFTIGNDVGTINYFPNPKENPECDNGNLYPFNLLRTDYEFFAYPPPFSLFSAPLYSTYGAFLAGFETSGGIEHDYVIDDNIDLKIINPEEKTIYNPIEATINIGDLNRPLIFPSGYTFKTINALYPSKNMVLNADPNDLYEDKTSINVSSQLTNTDNLQTIKDERISKYIVAAGSKLVIEPCVTILDAIIVVMPGAQLQYPAGCVYGNFQIIDNTGGSGIIITNCANSLCPQVCYTDNAIYTPFGGEFELTDDYIIMNSSNIGQFFANASNGVAVINEEFDFSELAGELIIEQGVRLEFGPKGKILIKPGYKLTINGTANNPVVLTSACSGIMWKGIEVLGNKNAPQTPLLTSPQGQLIMQHTIIEHAHTAVKTGQGNLSGGIIRASNCQFLNNYTDVIFTPYKFFNTGATIPSNNVSFFTNCRFETNQYLQDNKYSVSGKERAASAHVILNAVKNVHFQGNIFKCNASLFAPHLRGTGIDATNAQFNIISSNQNTFEGLSEGIWAKSLLGDISFIGVNSQLFKNNIHAIVLDASSFSRISNNIIEVPLSPEFGYSTQAQSEPFKGYDKPVGIYIRDTKGARIEENIINTYNGMPNANQAEDFFNYAIVANNTAINDGVSSIYNNKINACNIGIQAELDNAGNSGTANIPQGGTGLEIKCNTFSSDANYDITNTGYITPGGQIWQGTLRDQGFCIGTVNPAGNIFNSIPAMQRVASSFISNNFTYNTHSDRNPNPYTANITVNDCQITSTNASCTPRAFNLATLNVAINFSQQNYALAAQKNSEIRNLIDGGNTFILLSQIELASSPGNIKNTLLSHSPYLSDTVLIRYINKTSISPPGHLQQVLVANSPLSQKVKQELQTRNLPQGIAEQINMAQQGVSPRYELYAEADYYLHQAKIYEAIAIGFCLEKDDIDSAIIIRRTADTNVNERIELAQLYAETRDVNRLDSLLNEMAVDGYTPQNCKLCAELQLRSSLLHQNKDVRELNPQQLAALENYMVQNSAGIISIQNLYRLLYNKHYERYPYSLSVNTNQRINNNLDITNYNQTVNKMNTTAQIHIYPNPNYNNNISIVFSEYNNQNYTISIADMLGKELFKTTAYGAKHEISSSPIPEGMYIISIESEGILLKKEKIIIVK